MVAAVLTSPAVTSTGERTATLTVSSDQASGTAYAVITASATKPSAAQIEAGQDNTGATALWAGSQAAASGTNTFSATNITRGGPRELFAHFGQQNAGAEDSTVVTADSFQLHGFSAGVLTTNGTTSILALHYPFVGVSGTWGSGTATIYYQNATGAWVAYPSGAFTANNGMQLAFHRPVNIKVVLTGATGPSLTWTFA